MSNGRAVEEGTHDELYARNGMYRGLVDAQRISAEGTGDGGDETPEEVAEMDAILRHSRSQSIPLTEKPALLKRSTTGRSSSIMEVKDIESGEVTKTKFPLWYLFKKVSILFNCPNPRPSLSIKENTAYCS